MVPNGWEEVNLGEVIKHQKGYAFKSGSYKKHGVRIIRISDTTRNSIHDKSPVYLDNKEAQALSNFQLKSEDIILSTVGSRPHLLDSMVGKAVQVPAKDNGALLNQNLVKIIPKNQLITNNYLFSMLTKSRFIYFISTLVRGNANQVSITLAELFAYKFLLPTYKEQQKIATILGTWDKAISTTERLIDNSKQQKKSLMQQLLTGKKRLLDDSGKPFDAEWEDKYLHDVARIIVSPVDKKTIEGEIPVELCNYTDVYYNTRITKSLTFMKATAKQSEIDKYTLKVNDVIVTKDSETPGDIAVPALISEDLNGVVCGYHLAIIRPNNELVEGSFLNYLFSMPKTRYYFFTLATGATRFGLSVGGINKAHFTLPPLVEQQKIATLLTNTDKEIELFTQQLADLKQEKKALMQQLLTGKLRVKIDNKEVA